MANFDSGVASYIYGKAIIHVGFPVDFKGNADISCNQCEYYRRSYKTCGLNGKVCEYPQNYVGSHCPLEIIQEGESNEKI